MLDLANLPRRLVRSVTRHYPLMSGCGTLANTAPFKALATLGPARATAKLKGGVRMEVRLDDYVGRALYFFGDLDPKISAIVRRVLRPGDHVLDIGANLGVVTMVAAARVGPGGSVHAFEPQPDLCRMVQDSARLNGFSQVRTHEVALSNEDTEAEFFAPDANRGTASLSRNHGGAGQTFRVRVKNAAPYLETLEVKALRLVKIDVEGHEDVVLRAAEGFLDRVRPDVLLFESNEAGEFWTRGPVRWLNERGYALREVQRSNVRLTLAPLREGQAPSPTSNDFVAVAHSPSRPVDL